MGQPQGHSPDGPARPGQEGSEERLELLLARAEGASDPAEQVESLREAARLLDEDLGSPERALTTLAVAIEIGVTPALIADLEHIAGRAPGGLARAAALLETALAREPAAAAAVEDALVRIFRREERWGAAAAMLERRIARDPGLTATRSERLELAEILSGRLGRLVAAIEVIEPLTVASPLDRTAGALLAALYERAGRPADAVRMLGRLADGAPTTDEALALLDRVAAWWETQPGGARSAAEALKRARDLGDDRKTTIERLTRLYRETESWRALVEVLERWAGGAPDAAARREALVEAGTIWLEKLDDPAVAAERYQQAAEACPDDPAPLGMLAVLRRAAGDARTSAELFSAAAARAGTPIERSKLLCEAAILHEGPLANGEVALQLYSDAHAADPTHRKVAEKLASLLEDRQRWKALVPVLEALVRIAETEDGGRTGELLARLAVCAEHNGELDKAALHYERAVRLAPDDLPAQLALARLGLGRGEWREARAAWAQVRRLAAERRRPADELEACLALGDCARSLGEPSPALTHYREAIRRAPGHLRALHEIAALESEVGDFSAAVDTRRALVALVRTSEKSRLWEEIGDLNREKLRDLHASRTAYDEAHRLGPNRRALHKRLEVETELEDWRAAVATLQALVALEPAAEIRARYGYAAAVILRDELGAGEEALIHLDRALDDDPADRTFQALERILIEKAAWSELRSAYRKMIERMIEGPDFERQARLWLALGDLAQEHLGDAETAMLAFEVAGHLGSLDPRRTEQLAGLYAEAGPSHAEKAIGAHQRLLERDPGRLGSYQALARLFQLVGSEERTFWADAALEVLGPRSAPLDRAAHQDRFALPEVRLSDETFQRIAAPTDEMHLQALLKRLGPYIARAAAPARKALGFERRERISPSSPGHRSSVPPWFPVEALGYACRALAVPVPEIYYRADGPWELRTEAMVDRGALVWAFAFGSAFEGRWSKPEMLFQIARKAILLRPEGTMAAMFPNAPGLAAAWCGAMAWLGITVHRSLPSSHEAESLARALERTVPKALRESLGREARAFDAGQVDSTRLERWRAMGDLGAARVALLLAGDLRAAAGVLSADATGDEERRSRLEALAAFSVSEAHFVARRALGLGRGATPSAETMRVAG